MNNDVVRSIANAVLYEGYLLWPYRRSAQKNQHRFTIGGLFPEAYARRNAERSGAWFECDVEGPAPVLNLEVRALHPLLRAQSRDEAREVTASAANLSAGAHACMPIFHAAGGDGERHWHALEGMLDVAGRMTGVDRWRIRVELTNVSRWKGERREDALLHTFAAAHVVVAVRDGAFLSTRDPENGQQCDGLWPVLVGTPPDRSTILAAPIILDEYPSVSPESPGDTFDGCEIDALLAHSLRALSDKEKDEIRHGDPRAKAILDRAESLPPEILVRLYGTFRDEQPTGG